PNFADNQMLASDSYFRSPFWYRDTFNAKVDTERQYLHFDGINWKADVYLNGASLGRIDGAFREAEFDVTGILRDGRNDLAVLIHENEHYGAIKEQTAYSTDQNGGIVGADNPTMHATIGWDWIPTVRGRDIGIWDDVYLAYKGPVSIKDPFVRTVLPLPDTTSADVIAEVTLANNSDKVVYGMLKGSFGDVSFELQQILAPGSTKLISVNPGEVPALHLNNPKLWWPKGYGEQNLYDVKFSFEVEDVVSDEVAFKTGVRQMDFSVDEYVPSGGQMRGFGGGGKPERLSLYVNGRRFIGFGGNWGFPEQLLNYRGREYDIAVGYHADMNFTMIRNWVGMTGDKEFYEACDRHGVMVWQDFWLANPADGPNPYHPDLFNEIATEYVRRVRSHPSIGIYVGRNEGNPPDEINDYLAEMVPREHPGLYYIPNSASGIVSGGGPYRAMPVRDYFNTYGHDKFHSERGMPNVMNFENLVRSFGADNVEPVNTMAHPNPMYGLHDYTLGGVPNASSAQSAESFNQIIAKAFGEPVDAEEFAALAQWVNYDGYRAIFEGRSEHRRGMILWMSHPAWPSMVWQTYDYYFEPTGAYFGCKKACEPLHIQWNPIREDIEVVNYHAFDQAGIKAEARLINLDGKVVWSKDATFDILEDQTVACFPLEFPAELSDAYFIKLKLTAASGEVLSENFYWRGREEGNLQALRGVAKTSPKCKVARKATDDGYEFTVTVTNNDKVPAMMLRLKALDTATGDLVLPVLYSDNYFFLMPGESRTLTVKVRKEDCAGKPYLALSGFNVQGKDLK
ncbi:MAG: beta-glycosidase, partial [Bacteroidales bacterium]|nr:beta-glycosidase [Bacteroidales bacterium]